MRAIVNCWTVKNCCNPRCSCLLDPLRVPTFEIISPENKCHFEKLLKNIVQTITESKRWSLRRIMGSSSSLWKQTSKKMNILISKLRNFSSLRVFFLWSSDTKTCEKGPSANENTKGQIRSASLNPHRLRHSTTFVELYGMPFSTLNLSQKKKISTSCAAIFLIINFPASHILWAYYLESLSLFSIPSTSFAMIQRSHNRINIWYLLHV